MHITWHGHYTLKIQAQGATIVIDPYAPSTGLRPLSTQADVVILSHPLDETMSHSSSIKGDYALLSGPGEYNVNGFTLHAVPWRGQSGDERTIQRFVIENINVVNLASLDRELTDEELREVEKTNIDVLFVPVGGGTALDAKQAMKLITTLEPRLVIPIHFKIPKLKEKLDPVDTFAKEVGVKPSPAEKKVIVKASRLPKEEMETIILQP